MPTWKSMDSGTTICSDFHYRVNSINTEEQLTYERARDMYERAKGNLVRKGFVHSFGPDCVRKELTSGQISEPELATA
jgi:hypothetical protein